MSIIQSVENVKTEVSQERSNFSSMDFSFKNAASTLQSIFSLPVCPADFRLASPLNCLSQFLKPLSLSIIEHYWFYVFGAHWLILHAATVKSICNSFQLLSQSPPPSFSGLAGAPSLAWLNFPTPYFWLPHTQIDVHCLGKIFLWCLNKRIWILIAHL